MADKLQNVTIDDLKQIVMSLRMDPLTSVDPEAIDAISDMIKNLPSSANLDAYAESPDGIKKLQRYIGQIMALIDTYSRRDKEYKVRYKSRTGIPPRYNVLDFQKPQTQAPAPNIHQFTNPNQHNEQLPKAAKTKNIFNLSKYSKKTV